jgi:hypothetical protein
MWLQATEGETAASGLLVSCISHKLHGKRLLVVSSAFDFDSSATRGTKAEGAGESSALSSGRSSACTLWPRMRQTDWRPSLHRMRPYVDIFSVWGSPYGKGLLVTFMFLTVQMHVVFLRWKCMWFLSVKFMQRNLPSDNVVMPVVFHLHMRSRPSWLVPQNYYC